MDRKFRLRKRWFGSGYKFQERHCMNLGGSVSCTWFTVAMVKNIFEVRRTHYGVEFKKNYKISEDRVRIQKQMNEYFKDVKFGFWDE